VAHGVKELDVGSIGIGVQQPPVQCTVGAGERRV
jgi:hypothetical protein